MQIAPPFGYREIVPFLKTQKIRLPAAGEVPAFAQRGNAIPVSHSEFQRVARQYPIVFTSGDAGKSFAPVAVLGLAGGENLFFAGGTWAEGAYVPAYARRYPFCMARIRRGNTEQKERLICVEKDFVDEAQGEALFDGNGQAALRWVEIERLLTEYEADLERSREMSSILADYGLLEPFTMQATLAPGTGASPMQLTGMHRVNEKSLEILNAAQLKNLLRKGLMARIFLHLVSLENFSLLLERKAGRQAAPA